MTPTLPPDFSVIYRGMFYPDYLLPTWEIIHNKYNCEIFYSTFDTNVISLLPKYVTPIITSDPGPGPIQNIYRQTLQAHSALIHCTTDKVFMTRSDVRHKIIPIEKFASKKLYFSSIMSCIYGYPCPPPKIFFQKWNHPSYIGRFGDWFHLGEKSQLLKLYSPFTSQEPTSPITKYIGRNLCAEQYLFIRYCLTQINSLSDFSEYYNFIKNHIGIIDLKDLEGLFPDNHRSLDSKKNDNEYHNSIKHNMLQNFNYD